jgi:hypothetical protein
LADNLIQPTFAAGELSPDMYARVDFAKYHTGAALMRNFFVNYKGGASSRPGTQFTGIPSSPTGNPYSVRLRRFVFSATQQYILVFSDFALQFIRNPMTAAYPNSSNSGFILSGGSPYTISTPYPAADLFTLKFAQSADIMQITHLQHPRMILSRLADDNWTLTTPMTGSGIAAPTGHAATITGLPAGSTDPQTTTYLYSVTAVDAKGEESNIAGYAYVTGIDMSSTLGTVTVTWLPVTGAVYYKVYKAVPTSGGVIPSLGQQLGYIGYTYGTMFTDSNIVPDFTQGPPTHADPFSPQQIIGYNITNPGSGYDLEGTAINAPGGALLFPIFNTSFGGSTGSIVGLVISNPGDNIADGTAITASGPRGSGFAATVQTSPPDQNPATAAYFQQRLALASTETNPVTLYMSKSGFYNNFDKSNPIIDNDALTFTLAVQEVNKIEWMLSMPGGLVLFTDSSVQQLSGGSTSAINPLAVTPTSAVAVPISNFGSNDTCEPVRIVYEMIYVQSEGTVVRDLTYNPFFNVIYAGADLTLLSSHLFYPHTIIDWAYQDVPFKCLWAIRDDGVLLSMTYLKEQDIVGWAHHDSSGGLFESVAVIREGHQDAVYFVVNRGGTRYIERLTERDYRGGISWAWCLDAGLSYSGSPITTVSGITHLEGRSVMALADGVPHGPFVVSGGAVTLPVAASNIVVGLPIQAQLQTLYLDVGGEGRVQGKRKKIAAMSTRVKDTAGAVKMGTSFTTLAPFRPGVSSTDPVVALPPAPPGMTVGDMRMIMDPAYQIVGCVCIQQDDPLPITVLGVIPEIALGDT